MREVQSNDLTVLVPTFRARYLRELLNSLVAQTENRFQVVVADDASPDDIAGVAHEYAERLNLRVNRFESNLGGTDLARHWNRCLELVETPWVTLPGDDDVLESNCVQRFYETLAETSGQFNVYRFGTKIIDSSGVVLRSYSPPQRISTRDWLQGRLDGMPGFMVDHVFSRRALIDRGAFVSFPLAWYSDVATVAIVSLGEGIRSIDGSFVHWRSSGENISACRPELDLAKLEATLSYIEWLVSERQRLAAAGVDVEEIVEGHSWKLYPDIAKCIRTADARSLIAAYRSFGRLSRLTHGSRLRHAIRTVRMWNS